jgi:hypothetical protein
MKRVFGLLLVAVTAAPASAQIVVDGTRDLGYGAALAVQTVETQFGDNTNPLGFSNEGELDAGYAAIAGGRLYVMLTGNVGANFNKVSVFIDSKTGGENVLTNVPQYDFNNVSQNFGGLRFDAGFEADYHMFGRWNGGAFEIDLADRAGGGSAAVNVNGGAASVGAGTGVQSGVVNPGNNGLNSTGSRALPGFIASPVEFGFNNTNILGVVGGTGAANQVAAAAVLTGFEFSVALADIGNPGFGDLIKIHAAYGNGDNNFHSNQTLAGLPAGTGNLGGNGAGGFTGSLSGVNFNNFAGDQFFSIRVPVPEPSTLALAGLSVVGMAVRSLRRKK